MNQSYLIEPPSEKALKVSKKAGIKANYPSNLFLLPDGIKPVVLLSGGRTSGDMLRRLLKLYPNYRQDFLTCFANTGKEMPETLDFLHEIETRWEIPLVWLEYMRTDARLIPAGIFPTEQRNKNLAKAAAAGEKTHWFKEVDFYTASRDGKPFDEMLEWSSVLPNQGARMCSVQLKIRTVMRYLFSIGLKEYAPIIGIRKDEEHRVLEILASADGFEHPQFPMVEWGVNEPDVMSFWKQNDFDLQLESYEGNCDLCFLKALHKRVRVARERPETLAWWKKCEESKAMTCTGDGRYFRKGQPYTMIERLANEPQMFAPNESDTDTPCSCVERGFRKDGDL